MYDVIQWNEYLDLSFFYEECKKLNYTNNLSQEVMIDPFKYDPNFVAFILYKNQSLPIGSIVCHSFDEVMGHNSLRIARICQINQDKGLSNRDLVLKMKNYCDRFLMPAIFNHYNLDKYKIYITTNSDSMGTRSSNNMGKIIQKFYTKNKLISKVADHLIYKGSKQTVWLWNPKEHENYLKKQEIWP